MDGKRNGKGKYYIIDGLKDKLEFEGEFRYGKKWDGKDFFREGLCR